MPGSTIREMIGNDVVYKRGFGLFKSKHAFVSQADDVGGNCWFVTGNVLSAQGGGVYRAMAQLDFASGYLDDYSCTCPAAEKYEGPCKHVVALALQFVTTMPTYANAFSLGAAGKAGWAAPRQTKGRNPQARKTDYDISELMSDYAARNPQTTLELPAGQEEGLLSRAQTPLYSIEPTLTKSEWEGWTLSLKIGAERKYVVMHIGELLNSFESKVRIKYGKELTLTHDRALFSADDNALLDFLSSVIESRRRLNYYSGNRRSQVGKAISLTENELIGFLDLRMDNSFEYVNEGGPYSVKGRRSVQITARVDDVNPELDFAIEPDGEGAMLSAPMMDCIDFGPRMYVRTDDVFHLCSTDYKRRMGQLCKTLAARTRAEGLYVAKGDLPSFCATLLPVLRECAVLDEEMDLAPFTPATATFSFYFDRARGLILCEAYVSYGGEKFDLNAPVVEAKAFRDMRAEEIVTAALRQLLPDDDTASNAFCFDDKDDDRLFQLLSEGLHQLATAGQVYLSDAMKRLKLREAPQLAVGASIAGDLMDIEFSAAGINVGELRSYLESYKRHRKFHRLSNGDFLDLTTEAAAAAVAETVEFLDCLQADPRSLRDGVLSVPRYRACFLMEESERMAHVTFDMDDAFRALADRLDQDGEWDYELPMGLHAKLRPYQVIGYRWLRMLQDMGFGGILADEMGLGKTLQVIALVAAYCERVDAPDREPSLVVCPTSLVYNWASEFKRFAPEVCVLPVVGSKREREELLDRALGHGTQDVAAGVKSCGDTATSERARPDVLVTSYELLRRDVELYRDAPSMHFLILDEAQFVKNPATQAARAVRIVPARHRFALTGTPIENRLEELWSIFDFLMPGLLGTRREFNERYAQKITCDNDEEASRRLRLMCKPFILRRLKSQVLTDLPEKNESVVLSRMEGEQRKIYDATEKNLKLSLEKQLPEEFKHSKIAVLAELTKLRELCCDPHLLYDNYRGGAAKMDACVELIEEAVAGGHKVLVFSQFTSLLALLEGRLSKTGIAWHELIGSTPKKERARLVEAFSKDDVPVFLISLKAGGTGLNLVAADIVIHLDPWWNVAAQNQATDRTHRIGQKSTVSVFKLIAQDSIEERIVKLQESKRDLADQIIGGADVGAATLTREDLLELLEG